MKYLLFIAFELSGILFFGIVFSTVRLVYYKSIPTIQELINPVIVGMIVGSIAWIWRNRTKWYATRLEEEISRREQTEEDLVEFNNHLEDLVKKRTYELEAEVIERKKAEESLRSSEESLKETAMIAKVGGWETDLRGNTLTWSDETFRIHERDDKRLPDVATAIQYYHPEDQQIVSNAVQRAIEKGETFDFETRLITEKKTLKWVRAIGHVVSHQDNAVGIRGMIQDISEKKLADEQIKASLKDKEILLQKLEKEITDRKHLEEELQKKAYDLGERCKELECLYGISKLLEISNISLDEILNGIVNLLHTAWQFPEIAHSKIIFDDGKTIHCRHGNLAIEEKWSNSAEIEVYNKRVGVITIFYTEETPQTDKGVFQKEERMLLNVIAERLGKIIEGKQSEDQIKAALTEKETLLHEIHHRVKNNMQVISSLLDLQASAIKNKQAKEILRESQGRVHAMSAVHETLHGSDNLSEIELQTYLTRISNAVFVSYSNTPGRIKLINEVNEIPISINQASPLGLIVNELISNALKYAFPVDRSGEIAVKTKRINNELVLTISDNGVGFQKGIDWRSSDTLGLKLVRSLVEEQLGGSVQMEGNNGTKFTIKFNIEA